MDLYAGPDILVHKSEQDILMRRGIRDPKKQEIRKMFVLFFDIFTVVALWNPKENFTQLSP